MSKKDTSRRSFLSLGAALFFTGGKTRIQTNSTEESHWPSFQGDGRNSGWTDNYGPRESPAIDWSFTADEPLWASPVVSEDTVCILGAAGTAYGIDRGSGNQLWTISASERLQMTPVVFNDVIVAPLRNPSRIVAIDPIDGSMQWKKTFQQGFMNSPSVSDDTLFITGSDGKVVSYTSAGDKQWDTNVNHWIHSGPAVANNTVVVNSFGGVHVFDAESGTERWTYLIDTLPNDLPSSSPTIIDETLFVCVGYQDDTKIMGFNIADGEKVFTHQTEKLVSASPAVTRDHLVVGTSNHLLSLDWRKGTEQWRREYYNQRDEDHIKPIGNARGASPVISGDTIYVGTGYELADQQGRIYGLSLDDGQTRWRLDVNDRVLMSPAVAHDRLYIGDRGGTLYAIAEEQFTDLKRFGMAGGALAALGAGAYAVSKRWNIGDTCD